MATWRKQDLHFSLDEERSQHPIATAAIETPLGRLFVMAEVVPIGRALHLLGLHTHGDHTSANQVGTANLLVLVQAFMEEMDVDELVVTARLRTTGANPGQAARKSGSPVGLVLEMTGPLRDTKTIFAIGALAHRGVVLLRAKRAVETMVMEGKAFIHVPKVESLDALIDELATSGVKATALPDAAVDVCAIREKLGLTQEQFAIRYALDVDAVRNWETGRRTPDTAARSYLRAIAGNPAAVEEALWSASA